MGTVAKAAEKVMGADPIDVAILPDLPTTV
jgi:hypothetical protein